MKDYTFSKVVSCAFKYIPFDGLNLIGKTM